MALINLEGAYDLHVHSAPSIFERLGDDVEMARSAREAGMAGLALKVHHEATVSRAKLAMSIVPGVELIGTVVLNGYVGGLNPMAAEVHLSQGARIVFMPTVHALGHYNYYGATGDYVGMQSSGLKKNVKEPITIFDERGRVNKPTKEIVELCKAYNAILGTAHLTKEEILALAKTCREMKFKKLLVQHALYKIMGLQVKDMQELAKMGATIEFCTGTFYPLPGMTSPEIMVNAIHLVGAGRCILATDAGSPRKSLPPETLKVGIYSLQLKGLKEKEVYDLTRTNPSRLLNSKH